MDCNKEKEEDTTVTFVKEAFNDNTDCFPCRLVTSTGILAGGLFILKNRNNFGKVNGIFQTAIGAGFVGMALLRLLGIPPFQVTSEDGLLIKLK